MASATRYNFLWLASLGLMCSSPLPWSASWLSCGVVGLDLVLARTRGGSGGEFGTRSGGVASSGVGPGLEDQDSGLVYGPSPGIAFAVRVALLAAVVGAGGAEFAEGDGVAARFGQEVAAVAEHVGPLPKPPFAGPAFAAELPGGGDHLLVVRRAAQRPDLDQVPQPLGGDAGGGQGLGRVLGDVVRGGLAVQGLPGGGQLAALADDPGVGLGSEAEPDGRAVRAGGEGDGGGGLADAGTPASTRTASRTS